MLLGSADNLPLEDNAIKLAIAFETVYFWEALEKCFAEVKRTIEPGGKFVVVNDPGAVSYTHLSSPKACHAGAEEAEPSTKASMTT